ncbi:MAG: putative Ig domain-containing protein, partial [Pseudomonadota bacterium]
TAVPPLDLTPYFGDPDAPDDVTLSINPADLPAGLTFDPQTNQITGTPEEDASQNTNVPVGTPGRVPGTYVIPVTATDPNGATFTTNVTYVVTNPAPVAVDDALTSDEDTPFIGNVFTDNGNGPDADTDGIAFTGLGQANPDGRDIFRVSRVVTGSDEAALQPLVDGTGVGTVVVGSMGGEFIIDEDGSVSFDPKADFNDLGVNETRETQVVYQIDDGQGGIDTAVISFTVTGVNDAPIPVDPTRPVIDPNNPPLDPVTGEPVPFDPQDPRAPPLDPQNYIPAQSGMDGKDQLPLDLTPYFGDPDGSDPVTISLNPADLPPGLVFDPVTGQISGTPTADASQGGDPGNPGTYVIPVTVTDPSGATFTTNVTYVIENPAPVVVASLPNQERTDGTGVSIPTDFAFNDIDGDVLTFTAENLPDGLSIDPNTGVISGTLSGSASSGGPNGDGIYTITVTVDDGQGGTVSTTFIFEAEPVPPSIIDDAFVPLDLPEGDGGAPFNAGAPLIVSDAVNGIAKLGDPTALPADGVVTAAVNNINPLGGDTALETDFPITEAIAEMIRADQNTQGGSALHASDGLGERDGFPTYTYLGQELSLDAGTIEGEMRTLIWQTHVLFNLNGFGDAANTPWRVVMGDGGSLPSWINMVQNNTVIIEKVADIDEVTLLLRGRSLDGNLFDVVVTIDLLSGEMSLRDDVQQVAALPETQPSFNDQIRTAAQGVDDETQALFNV